MTAAPSATAKPGPVFAEPALSIRDVSKTFPGTQALRGVSFDVAPGEIHALLGGNGSGKSTLIKIMAGVYQADPGGAITVGGMTTAADQTSPAWAKACRLHFVHQKPSVFAALTVAENLAIGRGFDTRAGRITWREQNRRATAVLERFEIPTSPTAELATLRPATRTMVAIARALQDQDDDASGVLVLDEPTATLPKSEVDHLMAALRGFARRGQAILFVSHRLDEVIEHASQATILRDGSLVATLRGREITEPALVGAMIGPPVPWLTVERDGRVVTKQEAATNAEHGTATGGASVAAARRTPRPPVSRTVALRVTNLEVGPLAGITFDLHRGEILGVAGVGGSGRSTLLKTLFGVHRTPKDTIALDGKPAAFRDIGDAVEAGFAYIPEDRDSDASFPALTVGANITAAVVRRYWRGFRLDDRAADRDAFGLMRRFTVRAHSEQQVMATLSGGNQQKAILARWLRREPRVLLLDEPTQGVDVRARAEIYRLVGEAAAGGCAVLVVSSDFDELARFCDRVLILSGGRVTGELTAPFITPARLTELALAVQERTS